MRLPVGCAPGRGLVRRERGAAVARGVVVVVLAVVVSAFALAAAAFSAGPPTSGIAASCDDAGVLDGLTTASGLKGNPTKIQFTWYSQTGSQSFTQTVTSVGGKYGSTFSVATPTADSSQKALMPDHVDYSIFYRRSVLPFTQKCVSPT
jgi:hypothetical protein